MDLVPEDDSVVWAPLGGLGEIGLNCMVLACRGKMLLVDAGSMFPEEHMPGVDLVIPDLRPVLQSHGRMAGVLLTHGHEDHIGAVPYLLPALKDVPFYGAPLTLALLREKLLEHNMQEMSPLIQVKPSQILEIGPFEIEFLRVCHSIADGFGLAIRTPQGIILHSGDFKFDPSPVGEEPLDIHGFSRYGQEGVLLLLSDSTNVERPGCSLSESEIQANLEAIFRSCSGRIILSTFSSNIQRIREVVELTQRFGRRLYLSGRSMVAMVRIAQQLGYLDVPKGLLVESGELDQVDQRALVVLTTGSQGEPLSALSLMAVNRHKWLKVAPGDTVIFSSRFIPGNERAIYGIINGLCRNGARVLYEPLAQVHVSGHASREELKLMIRLVKPKYFVPIHGEFRHLVQHRQLAIEVGVAPERAIVAQNGELFRIRDAVVERCGSLAAGRVYVDGKGVGDVGETVLRDRQHLSEDGLVVAVVVLHGATGEVVSGPELFSRGFIFEGEESRMMMEARQLVLNVLREARNGFERERPEDLEAELRGVLRRHFWRSVGRRPMIMPIVVQV
ncbi:MAG: ribonuclease J [Thermodesulfobacteriota bacterium]